MGTTPTYGFPFQGVDDPPAGDDLGFNLATAVEAKIQSMDAILAAIPTGVYVTYSPTFVSLTGTNPVAASHSVTGRYVKINTAVWQVQIDVTFGSTNFGTGVYAVGLPFTVTANSVKYAAGAAHVLDALLAEYDTTCSLADTGTIRFYSGSASVAHNSPITFGINDRIWATIDVEPA